MQKESFSIVIVAEADLGLGYCLSNKNNNSKKS